MQKSKYAIIKDNLLIAAVSQAEHEAIVKSGGAPPAIRYAYQIKALRDIYTTQGIVKAGTLGGYIQAAININPFDESWIEESSVVMQYAQVTHNAYIGKNTTLRWFFQTPPEFYIDADHHILVDHQGIYSTKESRIIGLTNQQMSAEQLDKKLVLMEGEATSWFSAVPIIHHRKGG